MPSLWQHLHRAAMFEKAAGHRCLLINPLAATCPFVCAAKCDGSGEIKITPSSINNYLQHLARNHKGNPAARGRRPLWVPVLLAGWLVS